MIQSGTIQFGEGDPGFWAEDETQYVDEEGNLMRRLRTVDIPFPSRFAGTPTMVLSIAGLGVRSPADSGYSIRLAAEDVQPEEFNVRVEIFGNAIVGGFAVAWVAHDGS